MPSKVFQPFGEALRLVMAKEAHTLTSIRIEHSPTKLIKASAYSWLARMPIPSVVQCDRSAIEPLTPEVTARHIFTNGHCVLPFGYNSSINHGSKTYL